jgi:hypothetical protein
MTQLKVAGRRLAILFGAVIAWPALAHAESVDLFCLQDGYPAGNGLNVSIDMSASTAAGWTTGASRSDVPANRATITSDQVTWASQGGGIAIRWTLDRKTGAWQAYVQGRTDSYLCKEVAPVL